MLRTATLALAAALALTACEAKSEKGTVPKNLTACTLLQDLTDLQTMMSRGEVEDAGRTYLNKLSTGACKRYLKGTEVLIDQTKTVGGNRYACIRATEEKSCYWWQEAAGPQNPS